MVPGDECAGVSRREFVTATAAVAAAATIAGCSHVGVSTHSTLSSAPAPTPQYAVFELALRSARMVSNPFWDLAAEATFTAPSGRRHRVEGFFDGDGTWRVRFVPTEQGRWHFTAKLRAAGESRSDDSAAGEFLCQGTQAHGFLQRSQRNSFRMEYADGTPFYPVGVQTCNLLNPDFDGPNPDGSGRFISNEEWIKEFTGAINMVRTQLGPGTTTGSAFQLINTDGPLDRYEIAVARQIDAALELQRKAGIAQILILFQDMSLWGHGTDKSIFGFAGGPESYKRLAAPTLPEQENYIRYVIARWAAFVDIWEIFNEDSYAETDYLAHLAKLIRVSDPYRHLLTTNYAHPEQDWCEIITFHEYMGMPANQVDAYLASQFAIYKSHGKVVQNTEFGNQKLMPNVDPVKWRIAVWTAFMHECGLLFWSMSQAKWDSVEPGNANAYLGADSRRHFRVLNDFTRELPIDMRPTASGFTNHRDIRTYALTNGRTTAMYVHHFADHSSAYTQRGPIFIWISAGTFRVRWIDPKDGAVVRTDDYVSRENFLHITLPPVTIDLACRIDRIA